MATEKEHRERNVILKKQKKAANGKKLKKNINFPKSDQKYSEVYRLKKK